MTIIPKKESSIFVLWIITTLIPQVYLHAYTKVAYNVPFPTRLQNISSKPKTPFANSLALTSSSISSNNVAQNDDVYNTIMRWELKREILTHCDAFEGLKNEHIDLVDCRKGKNKVQAKKYRRWRWSRFRKNDGDNQTDLDNSRNIRNERVCGLFGTVTNSPTFIDNASSTSIQNEHEEIISLAERLTSFNPVKNPTLSWKHKRQGQAYEYSPKENYYLNGTWKVRFADSSYSSDDENWNHGSPALFEVDEQRGIITSIYAMKAASGFLTEGSSSSSSRLPPSSSSSSSSSSRSVKNFEALKIVMRGYVSSNNDDDDDDDEMTLSVGRIVFYRSRRFPTILKRIIIPIPSFRFARRFLTFASRGIIGVDGNEISKSSSMCFRIKYIDDNFCMVKTGDGRWFIQTRCDER